MPNQDDGGFCTDWASPPGNTIQRIIEQRKLSVVELADQLGLTLHEMQLLLVGRKVINDDLAGKLTLVLGSTTRFWLKRDQQYRDDLRRLSHDQDRI